MVINSYHNGGYVIVCSATKPTKNRKEMFSEFDLCLYIVHQRSVSFSSFFFFVLKPYNYCNHENNYYYNNSYYTTY